MGVEVSRKYRWPLLAIWFLSIHSIQAAFVVLTADWLGIANIRYVPFLVVFLVLGSGRVPFMLSVLESGFDQVRQLRLIQLRYATYVMENPLLRSLPKDPFVFAAALAHQAKRALLRSWALLLAATLILKFTSPEPWGDYRLPWLMMGLIELGALLLNGYSRGVLEVPVRPVSESRERMTSAMPPEWVSD